MNITKKLLLKTHKKYALELCHKITSIKLRALSYGVVVIVIVSKGKAVKIS